MTIFESTVQINQPVSQVYSFLNDLNNHQKLMPENIYNWSSTTDEAQFTIQNMAKLALKVSSRLEDEEINIVPSQEAPFAIEMKWNVTSENEGTKATLKVSADLNMMMKMLASGPLQKLVDHQTSALAKTLA